MTDGNDFEVINLVDFLKPHHDELQKVRLENIDLLTELIELTRERLAQLEERLQLKKDLYELQY